MKIIIDKIQSNSKHSISNSDLKTIVDVIPDDWIGLKTVFHLSSQLFENINWERPVFKNQTTYKIYSIGFTREEITKELLIEMNAKNFRYGHILDKQEYKKLEESVQPYFNQILERYSKA